MAGQTVKIEVVDKDGQVRWSILKKKKNRPLIEEFTSDSQNVLEYVVGYRNPLDLIMGGTNINYHVLKPHWRVNSQVKKGEKTIRVRLGTFFSKNQNSQTKDQFKQAGSLDVSGLGINDSFSFKNQLNKKSGGVRMWNDEDHQIEAQINVYLK